MKKAKTHFRGCFTSSYAPSQNILQEDNVVLIVQMPGGKMIKIRGICWRHHVKNGTGFYQVDERTKKRAVCFACVEFF